MRKRAIIFLILALQGITVSAQKFRYGGMQQLGLSINENNTTASFAIVNGVRYKKFFAGLGADVQLSNSYSYFYYSAGRSSALYLDLRYYINKNKNFFAKADGGINLMHPASSGYGTEMNRRTGYYTAAGIGFKARLGKETFYSFDIGYSLRQSRYDLTTTGIARRPDVVKYDFRRLAIVVNMGIEIF